MLDRLRIQVSDLSDKSLINLDGTLNPTDLLKEFLYKPPEEWSDLVQLCIDIVSVMNPEPVMIFENEDLMSQVAQGSNLIMQWPHYSTLETIISLAAMYYQSSLVSSLEDLPPVHRISLIRNDSSFPKSSFPVDTNWRNILDIILNSPLLFEKFSAIVNWFEAITSGKHNFDPDERRAFNDKALDMASEAILHGENVFFYPGGPYPSQGFKTGASRIIIRLVRGYAAGDNKISGQGRLIFVHGFTPIHKVYRSITGKAKSPNVVYFTYGPEINDIVTQALSELDMSLDDLLAIEDVSSIKFKPIIELITAKLQMYFYKQSEQFLSLMRDALSEYFLDNEAQLDQIIDRQRTYYNRFLGVIES